MEAKMMIAGSFDEFVEKIAQAERKALNTPFGQEITERLLKMKLEENPDMTAEEWQDLLQKDILMWTIFNILSVGMKILQKKSVGLAVTWKK